MKCSTCGNGDHRVLRTLEEESAIVRMRECLSCGHRWKTSEVPVEVFARANDITEAFRSLKQVVGEE